MSDINAHIGLILGFLFTMMGSSFATIRSVKYIDMTIKNFIPIIMAGILAIYGFIIILLCTQKLVDNESNRILSAGLITGICNLFSGLTMGYICDRSEFYNIGLFIALVFAESFALYGLVTSLVIIS